MAVYRRGRIFWVDFVSNGHRFRASLKTEDQAEAEARAQHMVYAIKGNHPRGVQIDERELASMLGYARDRAYKRHQPFLLTLDDLRFLVAAANGVCALTGLPFSMARLAGSQRAPFRPTIDRIDSRGIYELKNCRVVCFAVNVAMQEWGESVLREIAIGYCRSAAVREAQTRTQST